MKHVKILIISLALTAVSGLYFSCTKDTPHVATTETGFSTSATVQVFNAAVKAKGNYIYVDGVPVSGVAISYGAVFPATAYSFNIPSGSRSFLIKDTLPATTQVPLTFSESFDPGKSYTIFTYDTITNVKQSTVVNNIIIPKDTSSMLRFANFMYDVNPLVNVDVYSYRTGAASPVFTNVATGQVTDFVPYASGLTDTLYVYATGTTSPLIFKALVASLIPTRSYTSTLTGSYSGSKAIATFATY